MKLKQRIEFIDLAKGICVILVVLGHCGVSNDIPGWEIVRMPLYFVLSGLFFKTYGSWFSFFVRKVNKILVPFLFFYLISYILFYFLQSFYPSLLITLAKGVLDLFDNRHYFNGPTWFLLALFWCSLIFCAIMVYLKKEWQRLLTLTLLSLFGWYLGYKDIFVPLFLDVALTTLPFYAMGYYLKKTPILFSKQPWYIDLCIAVLLWGISFLLSKYTNYMMAFHYNNVGGIESYLLAAVSVMSIIFLSKAINYIPFVSYLGRYSIIVLCIHHMVYRPLKVILALPQLEWANNVYILAILTLLITAAFIPLCIRLIPWFVAQKDLFKVPTTKQHMHS